MNRNQPAKGTTPVPGAVDAIAIGRNEGRRLVECLASLQRAGMRRIVYVDSGSTDGSVAMARGLGAEVVELDSGHLVSRPFLREALAGVGPRGQLRLPGSMGPLLLANDTGSRLALVMPIRPEI